MYCSAIPLLFAFLFLIPLWSPFVSPYLLGTLLAVIGSCPPRSQVASKLISPFPSPSPYTPLSKIPTPWGFPELNMHITKTTSRTWLTRSSTLPLRCRHYFIVYNLVLLTPRRVAPSSSPASTSMRGAGCSSLPPPLGHHEYFLLRSSMLRLFLFGLSSSGSQAASVSIIARHGLQLLPWPRPSS